MFVIVIKFSLLEQDKKNFYSFICALNWKMLPQTELGIQNKVCVNLLVLVSQNLGLGAVAKI